MLKARLWIREHAVAVLLLLVYATLAITSSSKQSSTFDEIVYVSGGYSYWITGDYRIHPENGPLPQRWEALPLLWTDARFPARTGTDWWHSDLWSIGYRFFYGMGNDAVQILALSRGMTVVLGLFLGGLIYAVSRRIHGRVPGYLSLGLFAFCPSMLAHGSLATSDLAVALFFFLAVTCLWNLLAHPSLARAGLTSLAVAALFLTKMSAVILFPVTAILILLRVRDIRKFALPLIFMAALTFVSLLRFCRSGAGARPFVQGVE